MNKLIQKLEDTYAEAALREMGVVETLLPAGRRLSFAETLEENLVEVAYAEAADYEEIHQAILREHLQAADIGRPDNCGHSENEQCLRYAA